MAFPNKEQTFKPGQTGNANGRPKKLPKLDELIAEVLSDETNGESAAKEILKALTIKALKGDVKAAEIILNRAYGKPRQYIDHTTQGEKLAGTTIIWGEGKEIRI